MAERRKGKQRNRHLELMLEKEKPSVAMTSFYHVTKAKHLDKKHFNDK